MDRFWSSYENLDGPPSEDLIGKLKVAGNLFFESSLPINRQQVRDMLYTLVDYPHLRFIKLETPNLKKSFSSTIEAEDYLKRLVDRNKIKEIGEMNE